MKRSDNNLSEQNVLFVGLAKLIITNCNNQITLVQRVVLMNEQSFFTYLITEHKSPTAQSRTLHAANSIDSITNYQYQYNISADSKIKLYFSRDDPSILAYLLELKLVPNPQQTWNLICLLNNEELFLNGLLFNDDQQTIEFYEAYNNVRIFQTYMRCLEENRLIGNYKISNMLAEAANGRIVVDPLDYGDEEQEREIDMVIEQLGIILGDRNVKNYKGGLLEGTLRFRIIDKDSLNYAVRYLKVMAIKLERLVLSHCELDSQRLNTLLFNSDWKISDKLIALKQLNLSKNNLQDDTFADLSKLLLVSTSLYQINLSHNNILFAKEMYVLQFLKSIARWQLRLDVSSNKINNYKFILKYLVKADGVIPLEELDLSDNMFTKEDMAILLKNYLLKAKNDPQYTMKLRVREMELQEPHCLQFLGKQSRFGGKKINAVPLKLSKMTKRAEIRMENQDSNMQNIDDLLKQYGTGLLKNNFLGMKQVRDRIIKIGIEEQVITNQFQKYQPMRNNIQKMVVDKFEAIACMTIDEASINYQLDLLVKIISRMGLTGQGVNFIFCLKYLRDVHLAKYFEEKDEGDGQTVHNEEQGNSKISERENVYMTHVFRLLADPYLAYGLEACKESQIDYLALATLSYDQLYEQYLQSKKQSAAKPFIQLFYLLFDDISQHDYRIFKLCVGDLQCLSARIYRKCFTDKPKLGNDLLPIDRPSPLAITNKVQFIATYSLDLYVFNRDFIDSGQSSTTYLLPLTPHNYPQDRHKDIINFIQIINNFLAFLYYTPQQLSEQSIMYLSHMASFFNKLSGENEESRAVQRLLMEEFVIRLIAYFNKAVHLPLKQGILLAVAQFIYLRVDVEDYVRNYLIAYLLKCEGECNDARLGKIFGKTSGRKIDWPQNNNKILLNMTIRRGKITLMIMDVLRSECKMEIVVDQLDTVEQVVANLRKDDKVLEIFAIQMNQFNNFWLCELKNGSYCPLVSYRTIGELLSVEGFVNNTFYLKQYLFDPQHYSNYELNQLSERSLLCLYTQAKHNFLSIAQLEDELDRSLLRQGIVKMFEAQLTMEETLKMCEYRTKDYSEGIKPDDYNTIYRKQRQVLYDEVSKRFWQITSAKNTKYLDQQMKKTMLQSRKQFITQPIDKISQILKQSIIDFMMRIDLMGYTTIMTEGEFRLLINNHFIVVSKIGKGRQQIAKDKKRLKWMNVCDCSVVDTANHKQIELSYYAPNEVDKVLEIRRIRISGSDQWLAQLLMLIGKVAAKRLMYQTNQLYYCDSNTLNLFPYKLTIKKADQLTGVFGRLEQYIDLKLSQADKLKQSEQNKQERSQDKGNDKPIRSERYSKQLNRKSVQVNMTIKQQMKETTTQLGQKTVNKQKNIVNSQIPFDQHNVKKVNEISVSQVVSSNSAQKVEDPNSPEPIDGRRSTRKPVPRRRSKNK